MTFHLNAIDCELIQLALTEDLQNPFIDVTTNTLFNSENSKKQSVKIISKSKDPIVFCGSEVVSKILSYFGEEYYVESFIKDGEILDYLSSALIIHSDTKTLLMAERTILNFLRHLSAVSTLTYKFVEKIKHLNTKILDTRKTTPGMRHLEKYAVACGGGVNHRIGLYDAYMIKNNHIDLAGGINCALSKLPNKKDNPLSVIVEVRNIEELKEVIRFGEGKVDRVLLDNMLPDELKYSVDLCGGMFETEASGNICLENILEIAKTCVNYASVGMLTYGAGQVDLSIRAI